MGMLGAMAGLGNGLQDYSTLLNEKSKMDWAAQQEAIKHERALSLENLRASKQMELAEKQNTWATDRQNTQNTFTATENAAARQAQMDAAKYPYTAEGIEGQRGVLQMQADIADKSLQKELGYRSAAAIAQAEGVYKATEKLEMDKRLKFVEQLKGSQQYQSATPEQQKTMEFAALQPEVAKFMLEIEKSGQRSIPAEQQRLAIKDGMDFFMTMPEDDRLAYMKQLEKEDKRSYTMSQAAVEFGKDQLSMLISTSKPTATKASTVEQPPSAVIRLKSEGDIDRYAADLRAGKQEAMDALPKLAKDQQELIKRRAFGESGESTRVMRGQVVGKPKPILPEFIENNPITRARQRQSEYMSKQKSQLQ